MSVAERTLPARKAIVNEARESNSQPSDLESDALPLRHSPLMFDLAVLPCKHYAHLLSNHPAVLADARFPRLLWPLGRGACPRSRATRVRIRRPPGADPEPLAGGPRPTDVASDLRHLNLGPHPTHKPHPPLLRVEISEAREIRTPNLLIWSQPRCRCAIAP